MARQSDRRTKKQGQTEKKARTHIGTNKRPITWPIRGDAQIIQWIRFGLIEWTEWMPIWDVNKMLRHRDDSSFPDAAKYRKKKWQTRAWNKNCNCCCMHGAHAISMLVFLFAAKLILAKRNVISQIGVLCSLRLAMQVCVYVSVQFALAHFSVCVFTSINYSFFSICFDFHSFIFFSLNFVRAKIYFRMRQERKLHQRI